MSPARGPRGGNGAAGGVTVVVASRNRRARLLGTLDRLSDSGADEIVVVDNGSTDGTAAAVRAAHPHAQIGRAHV